MSNPITLVDAATPELLSIASQLKNPDALYKDMGRRASEDLRKHFRARDTSQPNKLGGRRTHFWLEVRNAVQQPVLSGDSIHIVINHPVIAGKVFGGIIRAKNASALTIPLHELAYGRRASTFEEETGKKLFRPKGKNVLMTDIGGEIVAIYALVKSVNMRPDPDALPSDQDLVANMIVTGYKHLARQVARGRT
jgi:hypothetical protein